MQEFLKSSAVNVFQLNCAETSTSYKNTFQACGETGLMQDLLELNFSVAMCNLKASRTRDLSFVFLSYL